MPGEFLSLAGVYSEALTQIQGTHGEETDYSRRNGTAACPDPCGDCGTKGQMCCWPVCWYDYVQRSCQASWWHRPKNEDVCGYIRDNFTEPRGLPYVNCLAVNGHTKQPKQIESGETEYDVVAKLPAYREAVFAYNGWQQLVAEEGAKD